MLVGSVRTVLADHGRIVVRVVAIWTLLLACVACSIGPEVRRSEHLSCVTGVDGWVCVNDVGALPWMGDWSQARLRERVWHACAFGYSDGVQTVVGEEIAVEELASMGYAECADLIDALDIMRFEGDLEATAEEYCRTGYELGLTKGHEVDPRPEDLEDGAILCRAHLETSLI